MTVSGIKIKIKQAALAGTPDVILASKTAINLTNNVDHHNDKIVFITPCNVTIEHSGRRFKAKWRTCYRGHGNEMPLWPLEELFARADFSPGKQRKIAKQHPYGKPEGDSVLVDGRIYMRCLAPWMPL